MRLIFPLFVALVSPHITQEVSLDPPAGGRFFRILPFFERFFQFFLLLFLFPLHYFFATQLKKKIKFFIFWLNLTLTLRLFLIWSNCSVWGDALLDLWPLTVPARAKGIDCCECGWWILPNFIDLKGFPPPVPNPQFFLGQTHVPKFCC